MGSRLIASTLRQHLVVKGACSYQAPIAASLVRDFHTRVQPRGERRVYTSYHIHRRCAFSFWAAAEYQRYFRFHPPVRLLHISPKVAGADDGKVKRTVEGARNEMREAANKVKAPSPSDAQSRPSLYSRVRKVIVHYYTGFRLLFLDVKISGRLLKKVFNGNTLTRRERKQFLRTSADLLRIVPFSVFIIVPFMELLLPVAIYFFPNMLPSTFEEAKTREKRLRQQLQVKLSMAKFLRGALEETAGQIKGKQGTALKEFTIFIDEVRLSGKQISSKDILRFAPLFEDELTLDNLNRAQLQALCKMLLLPTVGPDPLLRFHLRMKMRRLEADDQMIAREGIDSLTVKEIQQACRARGMRALGIPEDRLRSQLMQWIDWHLNKKFPTSLLLLSRTLYLPENVPAEEVLRKTISALPEPVVDEAEVKVAEVEGEPIDNQMRLDVLKQQEKLIKDEELQLQKEKEKEAAKEKAEELKETKSAAKESTQAK